MGFHFVAFGSENSEGRMNLRTGSNVTWLLKESDSKPGNVVGGTELQGVRLVERSEPDGTMRDAN